MCIVSERGRNQRMNIDNPQFRPFVELQPSLGHHGLDRWVTPESHDIAFTCFEHLANFLDKGIVIQFLALADLLFAIVDLSLPDFTEGVFNSAGLPTAPDVDGPFARA